MQELNITRLKKAARDFKYLLNKKYPRENSLELVGNRYNLNSTHRKLLHRSVHPESDCQKRREKIISPSSINDKVLGVDGHNVIITLESALKNIPIIKADDGVVRDIAGVSSNYRINAYTKNSISLISEFLKYNKIKNVHFYFDAPISHSGDLAQLVQQKLNQNGISCKTKAIKVPEKELINYEVVATSDSILIDKSKKIVDIAGNIIKNKNMTSIISLGKY